MADAEGSTPGFSALGSDITCQVPMGISDTVHHTRLAIPLCY
jgi:hypothetical protein